MKLYTYWRSSCSYRARIALNLKGLEYETVPVNLVKDGGEQHGAEYARLNPMQVVPTLEHDGKIITQSLAIIDYLETVRPEPRLVPVEPSRRAHALALTYAIAIDIQPINNLRVLNYLKSRLGADDDSLKAWYHAWVEKGFAAVESLLMASPETAQFCAGDSPTIADVCLVPQVYNAERFACDLGPYTTIRRIAESCRSLEAFAHAAPEGQPDAPGASG